MYLDFHGPPDPNDVMKSVEYLKGRPQELFILDYGLFKVNANGRVIGICGFLIKTDANENVLIDTGFPAKYAADTAAASLEDKLGDFGEVLELTTKNLPKAQLARCGLTPADIDLLIISHTHIDHVGGIGDFPHCPRLIAAAERALPKPLYWGSVQPIDWPEQTDLLIHEDTEIATGFQVLLTPGHAPGQLAFWLDLPDRPVLLTSDAISRPAEIDEKFAGSWDEQQAQFHADRIMKLAHATQAYVIYGHCPEQWPSLPKAPNPF